MSNERKNHAPPAANTDPRSRLESSRDRDDLLSEAARALRCETDFDDESGKFTRARVLGSLHQTTVRRRTRFAFVLPLAASFVAATAWGTVSGHTQQIASSVARVLGFSVEAPEPPREKPRAKRAGKPAPPKASVAPPSAPVAPVPPPLEPEKPPPEKPVLAPAPSSAIDPTHHLYRAAHHAHFVEQDCRRAEKAWSTYLNRAPNGRFAPEARYNRAICMIRLGEHEAARAALTPFARGEYGSYRQREAQALIEALEQ